jgi:exopolyphosphatase/guanosine-5'-triphosphate,3'-diphosphate pyrophosphatase
VWVGVGGTFTTSAALVQRIPWNRREHIHGFSLTRESVRAAMEALAPMPMEERLALPSLQPQRADIVVHGIAILLELDLPAITVSEYGNLEGYLKVKYLYNEHL